MRPGVQLRSTAGTSSASVRDRGCRTRRRWTRSTRRPAGGPAAHPRCRIEARRGRPVRPDRPGRKPRQIGRTSRFGRTKPWQLPNFRVTENVCASPGTRRKRARIAGNMASVSKKPQRASKTRKASISATKRLHMKTGSSSLVRRRRDASSSSSTPRSDATRSASSAPGGQARRRSGSTKDWTDEPIDPRVWKRVPGNPFADYDASEGIALWSLWEMPSSIVGSVVRRGRPPGEPTAVRSVRLPVALWERLEKEAAANKTTLNSLIRGKVG
jgi:hypothetical protein